MLDRLRKAATPPLFEQAVVTLLIAIVYGGSDAARGPIHALDCMVRGNPAGADGVELVADRPTDWAGPQADGLERCSASASGIAGREAFIAAFRRSRPRRTAV